MSRSAEVAVDLDLMREIEALPVRKAGNQELVPSKAQIDALKRFWKSGRRQVDIAAKLGVGVQTARAWWERYAQAGDPKR